MANFSKKFSSLLESMKSTNHIMEDDAAAGAETKKEKTGFFGDRTSTGKSQRRSDNKETRLENKFTNGDKFVIRAYIKAVDLLQGQVLATRIDIFNTIKNKMSGSKYGDPILRSADTLLTLVISLKRNAEKTAQSEGSRLEVDSNASEIKSFQDAYSKYEAEYEEIQKKWNEAKIKEQDEKPVLAANQNIEKSLNVAKKFFTEAQADFTSSFSQFVPKKTEDKKEDSNSGSNTGDSGLLKSTLKQRSDAYTGTDGDIVMEVKKLIYNKFKKYKSVSNTSDWQIVYKSWPVVTGSLRTNTATVIKRVKAGLSEDYPDLASDKTGDITAKFLEILKGIKEGLSHNPGKIVSFESFMKNKVNEDFDEEAAAAVVSSGSSGSGKKSSSQSGKNQALGDIPSYPATPFKTDEEGNKFREWVNKTHPDWAKKNNLDASGPKDNSYIRKAYAEYGKDYKPESGEVKVSPKKLTNAQLSQIVANIKANGGGAEIKITTGLNEPYVAFWKGKEWGAIYNNFRIHFRTSSGSKYTGTYIVGGEIKFDNGKKTTLKQLASGNMTNIVSPVAASTAQGKKAYVKSSGEGYVNVRRSAEANTGSVNNLIYKHIDKSKPIGLVLSSTVAKSTKIGDKTWYKLQFPNKKGMYEYGWVRADTVDLK